MWVQVVDLAVSEVEMTVGLGQIRDEIGVGSYDVWIRVDMR